MNGFQKGIKIFAIVLAIFIIINIIHGILFGLSILTNIGGREEKIVVENFSETYQNVNKIDIDVISANLVIKTGNEFRVEANNLSNPFSSELRNGTLRIKESKTWFWMSHSSGDITIYIPRGIILNDLKIDAGAGRIEISNISVDDFEIDQGAGVLEIANSKFNKTDINGGAGEIRILESTLNNMKMDAGVGKITLKAEITGNSKIECGIGEMDIELLGKEEEYSITAEKGIGTIRIENKEQSDNSIYGTGKNRLKLEGGVGSIKVNFSQK